MRLSGIRAANFRTLERVNVSLHPLTVIIGPNGVGKTTFLQLLRLFCGISKDPNHLLNKISSFGGFYASQSWRRGFEDSKIAFGFSVSTSDGSLDYDIALADESGSFFVESESLVKVPTNAEDLGATIILRRADTSIEMLITPLSQGDSDRYVGRINHDAQTYLNLQVGRYRDAHPIARALLNEVIIEGARFQPWGPTRAPQQLHPANVPSMDGSNLLSVLYNLKSSNKRLFQELLETLRLAVPTLVDLEFPVVGAGHVFLHWEQSDLRYPLGLHQLSDGTLRFLWLATVLLTAPDDSLLIADEPEMSLHPQWLHLLVGLFRQAAARMSVVVATQNAEFVRWLSPEEVLVADLGESGASFDWASTMPNIDKWLEDFSLSDLWTMGQLGGRR